MLKHNLAVLASVLLANSAYADGVDRAAAIGLSKRPEMAVGFLSRENSPLGDRFARQKILTKIGILGKGTSVIDRDIRFSPVVAYDGNINGGLPAESVTVSGLTFDLPEKYRIKSGLTVGGRLAASLHGHWFKGTNYSFKAHATAVQAPEHGLLKSGYDAEACTVTMLDYRTFMKGCAGLSGYQIDLGQGHTRRLSGGLTHYAEIAGRDVLFNASIEPRWMRGASDYEQVITTLGATVAVSPQWAPSVSFSKGSDVDGVTAFSEGVTVQSAHRIFGYRATAALGVSTFRGGFFLGEEITNKRVSANLGVKLPKGVAVTAGYFEQTGRHSFFADSGYNFTISKEF